MIDTQIKTDSIKFPGINFIKIESLSSDGKFLLDKFAYIDEVTHNKLARSQLENEDILFSIAGALGRVAIISNDYLPANTNQALAIIRLRNKNVTQYIYYFLNYLKSKIHSLKYHQTSVASYHYDDQKQLK